MQQIFDSSKDRVVVTDIDMPFWSMVRFMLKWSIATIPAVFILTAAAFGVVMIGLIILGALGASLNSIK